MNGYQRVIMRIVIVAGLMSLHVAIGGHSVQALSNAGLDKTQTKIERRFAKVEHISTEALAELPQSELLLFDIRAPKEYLVSHISGAHLVAPTMSSEVFFDLFKDHFPGKTIVFYCSVGQRSSEFADRVQDELMTTNAWGIYNLKGGLFEWHNEERPLTDELGPTEEIHPYNWLWARHIDRRELIRYNPRNSDPE